MSGLSRAGIWGVTLAAAGVLMVTMGIRQSLGLFLSPVNTSTGLGLGVISLALAVGQLVWGIAQPLAGAVADYYGAAKVLLVGLFLLALGCVLTPWMQGAWGFVFSLGFLVAMGSGMCSFSVLMGAVMRTLPVSARGMASGVINAGGSLGQFVFAPVLQRLIQLMGWIGTMQVLALVSLAVLPLLGFLSRPVVASAQLSSTATTDGLIPTEREAWWPSVRCALLDRSYLCLHAGFFTCGFHIAFLVTHLPVEVGVCGLPAGVAGTALAIIGLANVAGSLLAGVCVTRYRSKYVLFVLYAFRALVVCVYLGMEKTPLNFYLFAAALGISWLATVPPTATLVGKLFGSHHLGSLFGLTLLSHQIGGFFGAYLGGVALSYSGDYHWMWYLDIALAGLAALVNLPIREARVLAPFRQGA